MGPTAIDYAEEFKNKVQPASRRCVIGGNLITDPDDHIFIDLLTSDRSSFLHQFNFTHIDKRNLIGWEEREKLIDQIIKVYKSDTEKGPGEERYLRNLIEQLS